MYIPSVIEKFFEQHDKADYIFALAGGGPEEEEIRMLVDASSVKANVRFLGNIPNNKIQEFYRAADLFINPTFAEGFPRVLIEAMASGLPVVTTDAGGIKDIVGVKQSEYMVDKMKPELFAEKLIGLSRSVETQSGLALENLVSVQKFSTSNVANMYIREIFGK